ncbi:MULTISPECIES: DNA-methyltransferase [Paenibacillus]|uniref:DNA-methyltransferase n=1 Tax=Paenibacillus TaxID=44249 RepID=UPI0013ED8770|nr:MULTISPECIES: site-specific DNA-methyltransferase [Paenibacillus]KAF6579435.1 site-specific DNA-methyltransferase [Paenibacillus sp. EKM212P]
MTINLQHLDKLNSYVTASSVNIHELFPGAEPFVDLIITSPPYWNMKKYGDVEEQTGYKQSYNEYLSDIKRTFQGVYDVSKDSATLFVIVDTMKRNGKLIRLPDDIAKELESIGWSHQDTIIWDKGKTLPWSRKGQMRNVFEYILMFTKSDTYKYHIDRIKNVDKLMEWWIDYPERYNPEGKVPENIWEFPIPTQGSWGNKIDFGEEEFRHACPFPPEMMARLILLSSDKNDVVLDPYAGTGVLLATAMKLERRFLGIDTNPDYKKVFEKVTIPLIEHKWPDIQAYYDVQNELKEIMKNAVYRLRVLKYQKALIKRLRPILKSEKPLVYDKKEIIKPVLLNLAFESLDTQLPDNKLGKVDYFMVINEQDIAIETFSLHLEQQASKAPFTKYGLITSTKVISITDLPEILQNYPNNPYYLYTKGDTKNLDREITAGQILELVDSSKLSDLFDRDIPPLVSNVRIESDDYRLVPAIKYEKKNYLNQIIREEDAFLDILDFDN